MALGISENDLEFQPQFFITLEEAPYLDGKHVLFGTITGPTMFNVLRIGRTEVDESDLHHAPRITSVKILENPVFTDLEPQTYVPWKAKKEEAALVKKKKKRKGKKDLNVLSFGDELETDDLGAGMKSSHDVVASEVLSSRVDDKVQEAVLEDPVSETKLPKQTVTAAAKNVKSKSHEPSANRVNHEPEVINPQKFEKKPIASEDTVKGNYEEEAPRSFAKPSQSYHSQESTSKGALALKGRSAVEERLAKYKKKSSINKKEREVDTMSKLLAFQSKVRRQVNSKKQNNDGEGPTDDDLTARMARKLQAEDEPREIVDDAPAYRGQVWENSDDEKEKESWLTTKFKCRKHMDHASGGDGADGRSIDDYRVVDEKNGRHDRKRHKQHSSHRHDMGERRRHHK
jgi:peptidyl-prolyl cis-trans isomerase SDCCAG10